MIETFVKLSKPCVCLTEAPGRCSPLQPQKRNACSRARSQKAPCLLRVLHGEAKADSCIAIYGVYSLKEIHINGTKSILCICLNGPTTVYFIATSAKALAAATALSSPFSVPSLAAPTLLSFPPPLPPSSLSAAVSHWDDTKEAPLGAKQMQDVPRLSMPVNSKKGRAGAAACRA